MDDARLQRPAMDEPLTSRPTLLHGRRRHRSGMLLIPGISLSHPAMDDWLTSDADAHHRSYATLAAAPGTSPDPATVASQNLARSGEGRPSPWPRGSSPRRIRRPATGEGHDILAGPHLWPVVGHRPKGRNKEKGEKRESREEEKPRDRRT